MVMGRVSHGRRHGEDSHRDLGRRTKARKPSPTPPPTPAAAAAAAAAETFQVVAEGSTNDVCDLLGITDSQFCDLLGITDSTQREMCLLVGCQSASISISSGKLYADGTTTGQLALQYDSGDECIADINCINIEEDGSAATIGAVFSQGQAVSFPPLLDCSDAGVYVFARVVAAGDEVTLSYSCVSSSPPSSTCDFPSSPHWEFNTGETVTITQL
jgi:hypothetical protein